MSLVLGTKPSEKKGGKGQRQLNLARGKGTERNSSPSKHVTAVKTENDGIC